MDKPISEYTDDELTDAINEALGLDAASSFGHEPVTEWLDAGPLLVEMYNAGLEPVLETNLAGFSLRYKDNAGQWYSSAWVAHGPRAISEAFLMAHKACAKCRKV